MRFWTSVTLVLWVSLVVVADANASCSGPPTVTIALADPEQDGVIRATVHYNFPGITSNEARDVDLKVARSGEPVFYNEGRHPSAPSGDEPFDFHFNCLPAGTYVFTGRAVACGVAVEDSKSHEHDTTVTVSLSYEHDEFGHGTVTVDYNFPNTENESQRHLELQIHDGIGYGLGGEKDPELKQDDWTFDFNVTCFRSQTYTFKAIGTHCNGTTDEDDQEVEVDGQPTVSVSAGDYLENGKIPVSIHYSFPNTDSDGQRTVEAYTETASGLGFIGSFHPLEQSGDWPFQFDPGCMTVPFTIQGRVTSCNDEMAQDEEPVDPPKPPTVKITLLKGEIEPLTKRRWIHGTLTYDMGEAVGGWTTRAEVLPWTDAAGQTHAGFEVLGSQIPSARVGARPILFLAPSGAQQLVVLGVAQSCVGRATAESSVDCETPECATKDPVYLVDGNVRVNDGDPLSPIAGHGLVRTYNSDEQINALFGRGWTTLFDRRMIVNIDGSEKIVSFVTEANEVFTFRGITGAFRQTWPTTRQSGTLSYDAGTNTYRHRVAGSSEIATFRGSDGRLIALRDITSGREALFAYDAAGVPTTLTDSWSGISWIFTRDGAQRPPRSRSAVDRTWSGRIPMTATAI